MYEFVNEFNNGTITVRFLASEIKPEVDIYLDIDFLLHPAWPSIAHLRLRPVDAKGVLRAIEVQLPSDVDLSYRFLRWDRRVPLGRDLDSLRALISTASPDPDGVALESAAGQVPISMLSGPRSAPPHPVWLSRDGRVFPAMSQTVMSVGGRRVTVLYRERIERLALFLDGDVWLDELNLVEAAQRWSSMTTAIAIVPTPDRGILAERERIGELIVSGILSQVEGMLHVRLEPSNVAVVGQSFGGLAAASLVMDYGHRVGVGVISSGSFWHRLDRDARDDLEPGVLTRELSECRLDAARFFLHVGREERGMIEQTRMFAVAARRSGAAVDLRAYPGGHDYAWYRHAIFEALDSWVGLPSKTLSA